MLEPDVMVADTTGDGGRLTLLEGRMTNIEGKLGELGSVQNTTNEMLHWMASKLGLMQERTQPVDSHPPATSDDNPGEGAPGAKYQKIS
jgi:hypothetical protein